MNNNLKGLALLFFLFVYTGTIACIFESVYIYPKLMCLAFSSYATFQIVQEYIFRQNDNEE
jgi:hypothetical protein